MENVTYFTIWQDETRLTNGHTYKLPDIARLTIGDAISLDEPNAKGEYVITRMRSEQATGGALFPHVVLRVK